MEYIRLSEGFHNNILIPVTDSPYKFIKNKDEAYFISMMRYNQDTYDKFQFSNSVKGETGSKTNKIWADFDSKEDLQHAFNDAVIFCERLLKVGVSQENIQIAFSGSKGVSIIVETDKDFINTEVQNICNNLGNGLETFDTKVYDNQRIFRLLYTKHNKTGLYKIPISLMNLQTASPETVKHWAKNIDKVDIEKVQSKYKIFNTTNEFLSLMKSKKKEPLVTSKDYKIDLTNKPSQWRNCKWSLLQGNFKPGDRHEALMVIAATAKGLGYDKDTAYYLCKSALKKQEKIYGEQENKKEELYQNIIEASVYNSNWEGGQYSCQKIGWLQDYCQSLDHPCEKHNDSKVVQITETFNMFKDYATNIDALTVKTGIKPLDNRLRMTVGMSVGCVAAPGVGKTSLALQILNNMSKAGHRALFLSYDMYHSLVFQKLVQKHFQMQSDEIFYKFQQNDKAFEAKVLETIKEEYGNVDFCFQSGQTFRDIQDTIKESEDKSGQKNKLIVCDYNELVITDVGDATASSNQVAQKMREIANVNQTCVLSLFQPNKLSGTPADELLSYRSAKGGSGIEQSLSVMLGMSRPGYDPRCPENDKFVTISALKNRMGQIFSLDLHWEGLTGSVRDLLPEEFSHLKRIREEKMEESKGSVSDKRWD